MGKFSSVLTLLLLMMFPSVVRGEVEWLSKSYDFGVLREADGKVTGSVSLVNKGPDRTFISRVRPSCGCTGASYTTKMIEPGDTATISFTYNPQGRPGPFDKTVKVYMGDDKDMTVIRIRGTVLGSSSTLKNYYPVECGQLLLDNNIIAAGELRRGQSRHYFINVYNQGDKPLRPEWHSGSTALTVTLKPEEIKPGETATFSCRLKTEDMKDNGPFEIPLQISTGEKKGNKITVDIKGVVVPDSRTMSLEDLENAPQAFLVPEFVDLGENVTDKSFPFEFSILNEGKKPLNVERVYSRQDGVSVNRVPSKISGGNKGIVKGVLNLSKFPAGAFRVKVEVITDDPLHPLRTCDIVGAKK